MTRPERIEIAEDLIHNGKVWLYMINIDKLIIFTLCISILIWLAILSYCSIKMTHAIITYMRCL